MKKVIAIVGAGYVGMKIGLALAKAGFKIIAYDINELRIKDLSEGRDTYQELKNFNQYDILFTSNSTALAQSDYFIITISTPIDIHKNPNLTALDSATRTIGKMIKKNSVIIFESTIYPGATDDRFIPILEEESGLKSGVDFYVGYSPERVIPGNNEHPIEQEVKVISGQNKQALEKISALYQHLTTDLFEAPTIKVAEASKLLENIQRDVNIALMNEYAQIMDKMGISIHDVLRTAYTKWNFIQFKPGFVGGHCIPVDPYYLTHQAKKFRAKTDLISQARDINEHFIHYIHATLIKLLHHQGFEIANAKIAILGISYKANVTDTRHSISLELYELLNQQGAFVWAVDPLANRLNLDLNWSEMTEVENAHAIILTQPHDCFIHLGLKNISQHLIKNGVLMDMTGVFSENPDLRSDMIYWHL